MQNKIYFQSYIYLTTNFVVYKYLVEKTTFLRCVTVDQVMVINILESVNASIKEGSHIYMLIIKLVLFSRTMS